MSHEPDDPRRRLLIKALSTGFLLGGLQARSSIAGIFGSVPSRLPEGQSIYRLSGSATVNGKAADLNTRIGPNDTIQTGKNSELIFVVGGHSMILRSNTHVELKGKVTLSSLFLNGMRLLTGKLLSVSRNQPMRVHTVTATIGIRGTGFYVESEPDLTYFCTCYGTTDVASSIDPSSKETIVSKHHDNPLYILDKAKAGQSIQRAPFINHTDQELMLIETLVGRTPPFVFPMDDYNSPRRDFNY